MNVKAQKTVTIVAPFLNEEAILAELIGRLSTISQDIPEAVEVVLVDDGSSDKSVEVATKCLKHAEIDCWKVVRLARNFGQQQAYLAGLHHATGDAVVFLDADLQDPPETIPNFIEAWREGHEVVVGVRLSRTETGWRRRAFDLFHFLFYRCTGGVMPRNSGNFGLMDRVVADRLRAMGETNLFLPALRAWAAAPPAEVGYHRDARRHGEARQNWRRLFNLAWDGITSFSNVPLRMIGWLGFFIAMPSLFYAAFLVSQRALQVAFGWFPDLEVLGFTTVAVAILALGGIQLICLGVIGEYIGRIYLESKGRASFYVASLIQSD